MRSVRQISVMAAIIVMLLVASSIAQTDRHENLASQTFTIVDGLNGVSTSTSFNIGGTFGVTIGNIQHIGPEFTLTQRTVITEIGGFLVNFGLDTGCGGICPPTLPLIVEIYPSNNGVPDLSTVIATFVLSEDFDPLEIPYSSVNPNLTLSPGTYFALFAEQGNNAGYILASATFPFPYLAGTLRLGFVDPSGGQPSVTTFPAAVRILGRPALERCVQDDSSKNTISLSTETGEYQFVNCQGLIISGVGRITNRGCTTILEDVRSDRRVLVRIDSCVQKATASVQLFSQGMTFTISDKDLSNDSCTCD